MEILSKKPVASVDLLEVRVSEDEVAVYEAALSYLLESLTGEELENCLGATVDEAEAIRNDLRAALATGTGPANEPILAEATKD